MPDDEKPSPMAPFVAPAEFVERATVFRAAGALPAAAKPSATVMLLRDSADGPEVFMIRRQASMLFAGGMYVFPGGGVDPADRLGRDDREALVVTAIRETFEESGVLLARGDPAGAAARPGAIAVAASEAIEADRVELIEHRLTFDAVLAKHGFVAQLQWLRPWSRWITPDFEPRRYDTHFFVALTQPGHEARDMGGESDAAEWVTPVKALVAQEKHEWLLMPPTTATLRELLPFESAGAVFEAAAGREITPRHTDIDLDADPPVFFFRTTP
jgi:8-oxo-dGTP pyrophosphatase MutT (NUDIX family)